MAMEQRQDLGQPSNRKDGTPVWTGRSDEDKTIHARYARREIRVIDKQVKPGEYIAPAFPQRTDSTLSYSGMTLRDYFAAKAMQGLLAQFQGCANGCDPAHHAKWAYEMADAMLKAREA